MYRIFKLLLPMVCFSACVRPKHSTSQNQSDTIKLWQSLSISALKDLVGSSGSKLIQAPIAIRGQVIAHDKSGNLYKQIIIDDGTAAIPLALDVYNLYSQFPLGKEVQVLCGGLTLTAINKLPQLCYSMDQQGNLLPIPSVLVSDYVKTGTNALPIHSIKVRLAEVKKALPELYSRFVRLDSVEFTDSQLFCYAVAPELASASNLFLRDCDSNVIALRTSAYAAFASFKPPSGSGYIQAIYSVYNSTPQLILLDTNDIQLNQQRFTGK